MTRAARRIHAAFQQSSISLRRLHRESPIYRRRVISLFNRVHAYRNRIFHSLTPCHSHRYSFIDGEWKHYWECILRKSRDYQWGSISGIGVDTLYINISDLYSKDESYIQ